MSLFDHLLAAASCKCDAVMPLLSARWWAILAALPAVLGTICLLSCAPWAIGAQIHSHRERYWTRRLRAEQARRRCLRDRS
jgi:hypothetical protein